MEAESAVDRPCFKALSQEFMQGIYLYFIAWELIHFGGGGHFFFFFFLATLCSIWYLSSPTRD